MSRAAAPFKASSLASVGKDVLFGKAASPGEKIFTSDRIFSLFFLYLGHE
jgi:hypothetical protein